VARLRAAGCVFAEDEAGLLVEAASGAELEVLVARRVAGEPLEHVLGWAGFRGLRIAVGPGVFVPRRRTELMARLAEQLVAATPAPVAVVELCCGAAPIAVAVLAHGRSPRDGGAVDVYAADIDPVAVGYARRNLGERGTALTGDLFEPLPDRLRGRIDVLAVNTPYVPSGAIVSMPPEARDHEPRAALDGGDDGLDVQRRLAGVAGEWLAPGGRLLVETSEDQASVAAALFADAGLVPRVESDDELGATVVLARRVGPDR